MIFYSYSKINYTLEVGKKREDGYHSIRSIVQTVNLKDTVYVETNSSGKIRVSCNDPKIPCDASNTAYKAASLFAEKYVSGEGADIHIEKNIPSQAGLGGGSGNGTCVLMALNHIYSTELSENEISDLAAQIGSDCPLFVLGGTVYMTGRGEIIRKLPAFPKTYLTIIKPDFSVSTKEAYSMLDSRNTYSSVSVSQMLAERENTDFDSLSRSLCNDFEMINREKITAVKEDIFNCGGRFSLLSGSGSSIYSVFETEKERDAVYDRLKNRYKVYKAESEDNPRLF